MFVLQTFSLDEPTIEKIDQDAKKLRLNRSAFVRFLVWNYKDNGDS